MILVVKTANPASAIHIVDERKLDRARCDEYLKDYLEVPRGKIAQHPFCPKCIEARA
jgi:hypothetical protein